MLEFEPSSPPEIEPLMGWIGSRDPFAHIRLRFPDRQSAIQFAERQGWPYVVQDSPVRCIRPKSYADALRYGLADAITRAERPWDGSVSIADRPEAQGADIGAGVLMSPTPGPALWPEPASLPSD
jgi:ETC complex I subunit conserved region